MPQLSQWPLTADAVRHVVPLFLQEQLAKDPLTSGLYPTAVGFYPHARGHAMSRDRHEDNLVLYCSRGRGILNSQNQSGPVCAGDLVILPAGTAHRYHADAGAPWTLHWAHYQGNAVAAFHQHMGLTQRLITPLGLHPGLISQFNSLLACRHTGYQWPALVSASLGLAQVFASIAVIRGPSIAGVAEPFVAVRALMEARIRSQVSLAELAATAGLSTFHFVKRYREVHGYSPIQHFIHRKIEVACELLDGGTLSVNEVARQMGYEDAGYFSRLFRRITGQSPLAYQRSPRG